MMGTRLRDSPDHPLYPRFASPIVVSTLKYCCVVGACRDQGIQDGHNRSSIVLGGGGVRVG